METSSSLYNTSEKPYRASHPLPPSSPLTGMPGVQVSYRPRRCSASSSEHAHIRFAKGTKAPSHIPSSASSSSPKVDMDAPMPSPLSTTHLSRQMRGLCHTSIHHLLATCDDRHGPMIQFDMSLPPYSVLSPHQGREPATHPPQRTLEIICHMLLPWPIKIQRPNFVSVSDVLETIYSELRRNVSAEEFAYLPPQAQRRATDAYKKRYRRMVNDHEYEAEKRKGLKRVDFLLEHRYWRGLSSTMNGPTIWQLNVADS